MIPESDSLPENWTAHHTSDNRIYYYNSQTQKTQWEHPSTLSEVVTSASRSSSPVKGAPAELPTTNANSTEEEIEERAIQLAISSIDLPGVGGLKDEFRLRNIVFRTSILALFVAFYVCLFLEVEIFQQNGMVYFMAPTPIVYLVYFNEVADIRCAISVWRNQLVNHYLLLVLYFLGIVGPLIAFILSIVIQAPYSYNVFLLLCSMMFFPAGVTVLEFGVISYRFIKAEYPAQFKNFKEFSECVKKTANKISDLNRKYTPFVSATIIVIGLLILGLGAGIAMNFIRDYRNGWFYIRILGLFLTASFLLLGLFFLNKINNHMLVLPSLACNIEDHLLGAIHVTFEAKKKTFQIAGIDVSVEMIKNAMLPLVASTLAAIIPVWITWVSEASSNGTLGGRGI